MELLVVGSASATGGHKPLPQPHFRDSGMTMGNAGIYA